MSDAEVEVRTWPGFDTTLERLQRKYPRIKEDLARAFAKGVTGRVDPLPGYGHKLWKYRIASQDMRRGKSGGFRLIYYLDPDPNRKPNVVYALTIYAKSERADLSSDELIRLWRRFWEHLHPKG